MPDLKQIESYTPVDMPGITTTQVIASFNKEGDFIPLYIAIDGYRYRIASSRLRSCLNGLYEFDCKIRVPESNRTLEQRIRYYAKNHTWALVRVRPDGW